jgi:hypothetical protein
MKPEEMLRIINLVDIAQSGTRRCRYTKTEMRDAEKIIKELFGNADKSIRLVMELPQRED